MQREIHSLKAKVVGYFERVDPDNKNDHFYRCKIENCGRLVSGKQPSNLTAHVKTLHETFYETHIRPPVNNETAMAIKRLEFIQDCAELIAMNGCCFAILAKSGFRHLIADKIAVLVDAGYASGSAAPDYPAVRENITYLASQVEEKIKNEVKDKYISIMVDTATKNGKSFLGLSIQFVHDGQIVVRSLGIIELLIAHSSANLKNEIMSRLHFLGINKSQIIGITSDNAPNMIAAVKRFNRRNDGEDVEENFDFDGGEHMTESDNESDTELDKLLDDDEEYMALIEKHLSEYALECMNIFGIRCAAHTLQLSVQKAIEASKYGHLIAIFRNVCKYLRTPTIVRYIKQQNLGIEKPGMDVETRWSSLYKMVCKHSNSNNNDNAVVII